MRILVIEQIRHPITVGACNQIIRQVADHFITTFSIEPMQHAIISGDINYRIASLIGEPKLRVRVTLRKRRTASAQPRWRTNEGGR